MKDERIKLIRQACHVKSAQILFFVIGGIWLAFSVSTFLRGNGFLALLMAGNGGVLIAVGIGLNKYCKLLFWSGLVVLAVNILLTFTDQFGFFDFATLMIDLVLFVGLLLNRKVYLG